MFTKILLSAFAFLAVVAGWTLLFRFSSTPGAQLAAPEVWPSGIASAALPRPGSGPASTLLVFVHPQCSCTHATLAQLDRILERARNESHAQVRVALVVYASAALPVEPFASASLLTAPATVVSDPGGHLARRFGASTSGEIVLYSSNGRLLFQGGVTPERDHAGDSLGGDALRDALTRGTPQSKHFSVFGCTIFLPSPLAGHAG